MLINFERYKLVQYKPFIHILVAAIGLIGIVFTFSYHLITPYVQLQNSSLIYNQWAYTSLANNKPEFIACYLITCASLALYILLSLCLLYYKKHTRFKETLEQISLHHYIIFTFINSIILISSIYLINDIKYLSILITIWILLILKPNLLIKYCYTNINKIINYTLNIHPHLYHFLLLMIACTIFIISFLPFITINKLKISNDYLWIPEQTKIHNQIVNNNHYISQHNIGGLYNEKIIQFKSNTKNSDTISENDKEFIEKNKFELQNQLQAGYYFHHQNAMLGPINELLLGKDKEKINYLYGIGNTKLIAFLLSKLNKFTFEHFTVTIFSFYLIYFTIFLLACILFFKKIDITCSLFSLTIGLLLLIGFEAIRIAPGFNPIRHFLDLPIIMLFYGFINSKKNHFIYLISTLIFAFLAIYASLEFGLFIFISLITSITIYTIFNSKRHKDLLWVLISILCLSFYLYRSHITHAGNPMLLYSILGVSVAPIGQIKILLILLSILVNYGILITIWQNKKTNYRPLYLYLFLFFYSQFLLLYYIWYTEKGHLLTISPILVLFLGFMFHEFIQFNILSKHGKLAFKFIFECFCASILILGTYYYFKQAQHYHAIFKNHAVYKWNFNKAHFLSTMHPAVFEESIHLINRYATKNSIFIISRYDNFLPFLAGKYSAMPFIELGTSLVTQNEIETAANAILNKKPIYLFVDHDIQSNHLGDILSKQNPATRYIIQPELSKGRVLVLNTMKQVFLKVNKHYQLIESGKLIDVYQYKNQSHD